MDDQAWFDTYTELFDPAIEYILDGFEKATEADLGLVIAVFEDYLESDGDNINREIALLEIATEMLNIKYTVEDISWFDLYDMHQSITMNYKQEETDTDPKEERELQYATKSNIHSRHSKELSEAVEKMYEVVNSEECEELRNNNEELSFDSFLAKNLSSRKGFVMGSVEIPNNASRMEAVSRLSELWEQGQEKDSWVMYNIADWLRMYARAEATVANRNLTQEELREFMREEETPSERYW